MQCRYGLTLLVLAVSLMSGFPFSAKADEPVHYSGVYPHTAAMSTSNSESGIGAVVPWAGKLWYVSYVAHKSGEGVGLYEIGPDWSFQRRPESVVGTHADRMIHRESNQLLIGPYAIDAEGNVRTFDDLTGERLTAVFRHLTDPAGKVYFQAMESNFYEADVRTLEAKLLYNLREVLEIPMGTHFKGGYTAQGRVVVANNSYFEPDQRVGHGPGRLAEWDGHKWRTIEQTAFCDVTTAGGIHGAPAADSPLWAIGWDKRSVILRVLTGGKWARYRLPKGSQSYDQAWCTEWPRIREVAPGQLMLDMHGLYYEMSPEFCDGNAGGLRPIAQHLKMTPDFCRWGDRLVLAGDDVSSLGYRHRTGGQPQSNLWFGTLDEIRGWGEPGGWGGPWLEDDLQAGTPSDPFFIQGFRNRTLHVWQGGRPAGLTRCTNSFEIVDLPAELAGLAEVTVDRGSMEKPGTGYSFHVNRDVTVYLAVHDRGAPTLPDGWEPTGMTIEWTHGGPYTDTVYCKRFAAGTVDIPPHDGHNELHHFGVPHTAFVQPAGSGGDELQITGLPAKLSAKATSSKAPAPGGETAFTVELDRDGHGKWETYETIRVPAGGYACRVLPDDLEGVWLRLTPDRGTTASAQLMFGPAYRDRSGVDAGLFDSLSPAAEKKPRIHGGLLPWSDRLWLTAYQTKADGQPTGEGGLYEIDETVNFVRRAESLRGAFANRKMLATGMLSIGPHLIDADGNVRTIPGVEGEHVVSTVRHPERGKMFLLTIDGRLLEVDLASLAVKPAADIKKELHIGRAALQFKAGHLAGKTVIVAATVPRGLGGLLAEWNGQEWRQVDDAAYAEISNLGSMSEKVVATGWDRASVILASKERDGRWTKCRLPRASSVEELTWPGEWPRIREVVTERMLLDAGGMFYEMSALPYAWSIRPISAHRRMIPDFCSWRGLLVLAGNDAAAQTGGNYVRGGDAAGLWFGTVDDLWKFPKPAGEGGPWCDSQVKAGEPSDPFLMAGFERKRVELSHNSDAPVTITLEVDPTVQRDHWQPHTTVTVPPGEKVQYRFPDGFSGHWVRVRADRDTTATAWFVYE